MRHARLYPLAVVVFMLALSLPALAQQVTVSAADYSDNIAPGSIVAAFGEAMAETTASATSLPLPTSLGGVRVLVNGKAAPLFFVSPGQINYQIPPDARAGDAEIVIERGAAAGLRETRGILPAAFAIFTEDQSGSGDGAIIDGRTYKTGPFPTANRAGEPTIVAMFGTGLGEAGSGSFVSNRVHVYVGGIEAKVHYAGPQNGYAGLDQINFELPADVTDHGTLPVMVKIDELESNQVTLDTQMTEVARVSVAMGTGGSMSIAGLPIAISPFADLDSLKVNLKSFNIVTDKGVEVALLKAPTTVDVLRPDFFNLLRVSSLKPGTYVSVNADIASVSGSFKGQNVAVKLVNAKAQQKLAAALTLTRESNVAISLQFDVKGSVKKADSGYLFDPILAMTRLSPIMPPPVIQNVMGKITGIDKTAKLLKVLKGEGSGASTVAVDASRAAVFDANGRAADFNGLAVDQKVEIIGVLDDKGTVQARSIHIGGIKPPPRPLTILGRIERLDKATKTMGLKVEHASGPVITVTPLPVKWDDKTVFRDELNRTPTADSLAVGQQVSVFFTDPAGPAATSIQIIRPHISALITDVKGLPNSIIVANRNNISPTALPVPITVSLKSTTKISNILNETLKPADLQAGAQAEIIAESLVNNNAVAEVIVVIGINARGITAVADVKPADKTFGMTPAAGAKVTVKIDDKTSIFVTTAPGRGQQLKADDFLKLLAGKPHTVDVYGLAGPGNTLRAISIRAEEKK
ncbi:MAG: DUF5666 domain-containing protein [Blastocatellia bacterium]